MIMKKYLLTSNMIVPVAAAIGMFTVQAKINSIGQKEGLCVIGSTPFVDPSKPNHGIKKYWKLVEEMSANCKVTAHVGNIKPGKSSLVDKRENGFYLCARAAAGSALTVILSFSPCTAGIVFREAPLQQGSAYKVNKIHDRSRKSNRGHGFVYARRQ